MHEQNEKFNKGKEVINKAKQILELKNKWTKQKNLKECINIRLDQGGERICEPFKVIKSQNKSMIRRNKGYTKQ